MTSSHYSMKKLHIRKPGKPVAFSLVETVLAMAVMGLAVTVLLGLLPHGLEMSRKAGISAGESRVTGDIIAELSQQEWATLPTYDKQKFFFDDQGVRITDENGSIAYVAETVLPVPAQLPGAPVVSNDIKRVLIHVAASARREFDFTGEASFSTFTFILPRSN